MSHWITRFLQQQPWLRHLLFWGVSLTGITWYYATSGALGLIDWAYAGVLHVVLVPWVYFNLRWLVPCFLRRERYGQYALGLLLGGLAAYGLHELIFRGLMPHLANWSFYMVSFYQWQPLAWLLGIYGAACTLLKQSQGWWRTEQLERENLALSLAALQAQVNPHFLFNSLHSLYALARKQAPNTPELLLALSDMLRYMLYQAREERVSLAQEVEYLEHYLAFQRLRTDDSTTIQWEVVGDPTALQVVPLLLVPLAENAFKHGLGPGPSVINLSLEITPQGFSFTSQNTLWPDQKRLDSGGLGLDNVRQRLQGHYPKRHSFSAAPQGKEFLVHLMVKL